MGEMVIFGKVFVVGGVVVFGKVFVVRDVVVVVLPVVVDELVIATDAVSSLASEVVVTAVVVAENRGVSDGG